jgi:outer membrane receptor protein involved in Fe transport
LRPIARLCGLAALSALAAFSQINTATLSGTITDPSRAMIATAVVEVRNESTGFVKNLTAEGGEFTITFLPIGTYTVTVSAPGFQKLVRSGLQLAAGQSLKLDLQLQVGSVSETVSVSSEAPLLQTETTTQLRTLTTSEVRELPQAKLDWTALANLSSGIRTLPSSGAAGGTGTISMNGITGEAMSITVDGTNASTDPEVPATGIYQQPNVINTLNTDAIAEVSIVKGILPASVGGTMAGNVNLISKGGTNTFHGDVFEFNSVSAENARNQFLKTKPRSTFNQYGGSIGGPILKDRLFFFGSYEGVRASRFQALTGNVPSPYLESISPPIYSSVFAVFPKVAQPANNPTALSVPYVGVGSVTQRDSHTAERIDYNISSYNQLALRYTRQDTYQLTPRLVASNRQSFKPRDDMYNANFTHSSSDGTWTSSSRFGYNRLYMLRVDEGFSQGLEGVGLSPWSSGGAEYYVLHGSTTTYMEDISFTHGAHSVKFGGILQRMGTGRFDLNTAEMSYSTPSDFLANIPASVTITFDVPDSNLSNYQYGGYVMDDYKVSPNLTLNLGLRYDYFSVPRERDGSLFNRGVDPNRPGLGPGFGPYLPPSSIYNGDFNNFQPRIGLAWSLGGTPQDRHPSRKRHLHKSHSDVRRSGHNDAIRAESSVPQHVQPDPEPHRRPQLSYPEFGVPFHHPHYAKQGRAVAEHRGGQSDDTELPGRVHDSVDGRGGARARLRDAAQRRICCQPGS